MARRALHLRRQYVEGHLLLFGALLLVFAGAMAAAMAVLEDPARGLVSGALPILFGVVVWITTNAASYRLRRPDTLPEERSGVEEPVRTEEPTGDPFTETRPPLTADDLAAKAAATAAATAGKKRTGRGRRKKTDAA